MVDIIKFPLPVPILFSTNIHRRQKTFSSKQIPLPILVSTDDCTLENDHTTIIQNNKRWTGRCPGDVLRQLETSNAAYNIHRKTIYRELAQFYPAATLDISAAIKIKQQQKNCNKEPSKVIIGTAATVASLPTVSSVDAQSSRLFDTLSKHVTIKAEPLRPTNYFVTNTNKIVSPWQKYWTSTHTQRRRKESNGVTIVAYRSKPDQQPLSTTTHFITIHDTSFCINHENNTTSRKSSTISNYSVTTKYSSPIIPDEQESFINEDQYQNLFPTVLPRENISSMTLLKSVADKRLSPIESEGSIIHNDDKIQNETNILPTKLYKLPLPSNKPTNHKSSIKQRSQSKSSEKKETTVTSSSNTSVSKNKHQTSSNKTPRITIKKTHSISAMITATTPKSKYDSINWEEPYVGIRFDPPTPPCSPSLFVWPVDSDQEENDAALKSNSFKEI